MNKRGLGRGLGALLSAAPGEEDELFEVPIDRVEVNPNQPRRDFDAVALDELTASIKASGIIQPVVVRRQGTGYQLIVGERRWRAARQAGLLRIPAVVREATDAQSLELALVEPEGVGQAAPSVSALATLADLTLGSAVRSLLEPGTLLATATLSLQLQSLDTPGPIQADLRAGRLTMGHARALLSLTNVVDQLKLRDEILAHSWSVRATEDSVRTAGDEARTRRGVARAPRRRSAELAALEESLQRALMTRVRITGDGRRGRIEVVYATPVELERLGALLGARH